MNIIPYEDLKITTMTLIMTLSSPINIHAAFFLLPIRKIFVQQTKQTTKCKLPHCNIPGSILSMRYRNNVRGIIKNKTKPFKNAITLDISTVKKNISLKLSPQSIQMCGASSLEDGMEAANHIINHLKKIQHILNKIQLNFDAALAAINWVKENTKGEEFTQIDYEERIFSNVLLRVLISRVDHTIIKCALPIPKSLDEEIVLFLFSLCGDFVFHSDMCRKLDFITNIKTIIGESLEITSVDEVMVNYNFNLGFKIDRVMLDSLIDGKNGFVSRYNNALSTAVTVELPYEINEPEETDENKTNAKRRKNKVSKVSALCYKSGSCTFSGRGVENTKHAYYLFIQTIQELYPAIEYQA